MTARHKLNAASITGIAIVAGLVGALTHSWDVFLLTATVPVLTSLIAGDIRFGGRK